VVRPGTFGSAFTDNHLEAADVKPDNMLLYYENMEAVIRDDGSRNPPRKHPLAKSSECVPAFLLESQPLVWTSPLDTNRLSEMHFHVKLADLGTGNDSV
jgi:hypothetical protein